MARMAANMMQMKPERGMELYDEVERVKEEAL